MIRSPAFACGCGQVGCLDTVGILARWVGGKRTAAVELWLELVSGQLAMVVNVVGGAVVPVGGGLAMVLPLIGPLDVAVRARILRRMDAALVVPAQVSADAGLIGAAAAGAAAYVA